MALEPLTLLGKKTEQDGGPVDHRYMTVAIPASLREYEHDLHRFFDAMLYKLDKNSKKGKWESYQLGDALLLLKGEVEELKEALENRNTVEIVLEAADIANFALITANIAIDRGR